MAAYPDPARPLDADAMAAAIERMLSGEAPEAETAAFLVALAERGETADEIAAAAGELRARMLRVTAPPGAIDVCGTGGDGAHSLNVSTAVAFVVAAAGVPVAKHGNRAASSRSGAADVLSALGWQADVPTDRLERCLADVGIVFLHAGRHHPAMAAVAPIRRAVGRRTLFNLLGPLANPASVTRQMIGVFARDWLLPMAEAARLLGASDVLSVHGEGLDELAVHAPSDLVWMRGGRSMPARLDPAGLGIERFALSALAGGSPEENAEALRELFAGNQSREALRAYRAVTLLNSAAALKLAGAADSWDRALALAAAAIDEGAAADRLARFLAFR